jgi:short-subunit dehydrogenase
MSDGHKAARGSAGAGVDPAVHGPWAVIAGGSEGVGAELADRIGRAGISLLLIARKPGPLQDTARRVADAHGVEVRTLAVDLLDADAGRRIREASDGLDVGMFIHNAGANNYGAEFVDGDLASFRRVVDLNVACQLELVHHFGARLKKRGSGALVTVGSLSGYVGHEHIGVYAAAKAFSRIFTEGLWSELAPHGVQVLHAVLGLTRTPAMERLGLRMDVPGVHASDAGDVAEELLTRLGDGPVQVLGGNAERAQRNSGPDRARLVAEVAAGMRVMSPR